MKRPCLPARRCIKEMVTGQAADGRGGEYEHRNPFKWVEEGLESVLGWDVYLPKKKMQRRESGKEQGSIKFRHKTRTLIK